MASCAMSCYKKCWKLLVSLPSINKTPKDKQGRVWACLQNQLHQTQKRPWNCFRTRKETAVLQKIQYIQEWNLFKSPEPVHLLLQQVQTGLAHLLQLQVVKHPKIDETCVYETDVMENIQGRGALTMLGTTTRADVFKWVKTTTTINTLAGDDDRTGLLTTEEQQDAVSDPIPSSRANTCGRTACARPMFSGSLGGG